MRNARVGDIATLRRIPIEVDPAGTYRELGIRSFGLGVFHKAPVSGASLGGKRVFAIRPGDLVLSNVFAWEGAIAIAGEAEEGMIGSHRFMTYEVDPNEAEASYLRYHFLSKKGLEQIRRASPGSAGRNRTLGIAAFEALEIPLPSLAEQRALASRLASVGQAAARIRLLSRAAARIGAALPSSLAQRRDLTTFEKEASGWRKTRLREVMCLSKDEVRVSADTKYPNIGILSFGRGVFEKTPIDGSDTSAVALYRIAAGQFIYSRLFAFEGAYSSVPSRFDGYFVSNEFPTFDVDDAHVDAAFLAAYFRSEALWEDLARSSHGLGVRRQRVHPDALLAFEVWIPPRSIQMSVVDQLDKLAVVASARDTIAGLSSALEASAINRSLQFGEIPSIETRLADAPYL